jgi:general secretion pathway protein F
VQIGLRSEKSLAAGFDGAGRVATATDRIRYALDAALIYQLVVAVLAYAGTICLCIFFVPALESTYQTLRLTPGPGLRVLQLLRDAMPYWIIALPLLLALLLVWRLRIVRQRLSRTEAVGLAARLPGFSKVLYQVQCARLADALAELIGQGVPLSEALHVAADSTGNTRLHDAVGRLSLATQDGRLPADDSPTALRFPPFLRWAIWQSDDTIGRAHALTIAAGVYREAVERRSQRLRTLAPMVAMVLLGGTITLLYCLALFVPLVELLQALSK